MQRRIHVAVAGLLGLGVAAAAVSAVTGASPGPGVSAQAVIEDVRGAAVGTFLAEPDGAGGTRITISVEDMPAGFHGLNVHDRGVCDPTSVEPGTHGGPFASAGAHLDPHSRPHPDHSGDLPPLLVNADGTGKMSVVTDRFLIDDLLDGDGSAIIIHAKPDNLAHIPVRYTHRNDVRNLGGPDSATLKTGDSGDRTACGVIG